MRGSCDLGAGLPGPQSGVLPGRARRGIRLLGGGLTRPPLRPPHSSLVLSMDGKGNWCLDEVPQSGAPHTSS